MEFIQGWVVRSIATKVGSLLALTATLFVVWYTNDNPGATVVGWTWTVAETALALVMAAILMRFFIALVAAAWVGVTTTLQELEVQQIELTQARQLLRDVGDVARNAATVQREAMGLAREQARLGEDTLRLRREVQDCQTQLRAERENVRSIEESPGVKAAHRYIPLYLRPLGCPAPAKAFATSFTERALAGVERAVAFRTQMEEVRVPLQVGFLALDSLEYRSARNSTCGT